MTAKILNGQLLAQRIRGIIASEIEQRTHAGMRQPGLAVILVGDDPASQIYVKKKQHAAEESGILSKTYNLPSTTTEQELLQLINTLNADPCTDGILVQLPLPKQINPLKVVEFIAPNKDVDGLHPINVGKLAQGLPALRPCTPFGIMSLLETTKVNLVGMHAVIVGTSNIVGKPMALELLNKKATITVCNSKTINLPSYVQQADILVSATGQAHLIKGSWLKPGAIVIDVGINHLADGHLVGDVEFDTAKDVASWLTPVPGGVGPMTIAILLENTLLANKLASRE